MTTTSVATASVRQGKVAITGLSGSGLLGGIALAVVSYVQKDMPGLITGAAAAATSALGGIAGHVRMAEADVAHVQAWLDTEATVMGNMASNVGGVASAAAAATAIADKAAEGGAGATDAVTATDFLNALMKQARADIVARGGAG
jgi:hypothetical protein